MWLPDVVIQSQGVRCIFFPVRNFEVRWSLFELNNLFGSPFVKRVLPTGSTTAAAPLNW